jgi:hypothetical protein
LIFRYNDWNQRFESATLHHFDFQWVYTKVGLNQSLGAGRFYGVSGQWLIFGFHPHWAMNSDVAAHGLLIHHGAQTPSADPTIPCSSTTP